MIRVIGLHPEGVPVDYGFQEGTIESVRKIMEQNGYKIYSIQKEDSEDASFS
ncbi:hypothetical protein [Terribacillus sp. JSM ZJ617]|uniref:hypothetical protein n=1 Tax=Terribacillus sp. JSM ZJ617 TaxID=3342119 RepID=UPI0035A95C06